MGDCKILLVRGVDYFTISLDTYLDDYVVISIAPEFWILSRMAAGLLGGSFFLYGFTWFILADIRGHFRKRESFDYREE